MHRCRRHGTVPDCYACCRNCICNMFIRNTDSYFKICCDKKNDFLWLISGLLLSIPTSLILTFIVYTNADFIATRFILNEACSSLLKILSLSFPFAAFHNCINGFYFAKKKTSIPAFSQLFEQIIRFCAVYIYVTIYASDGNASVLCAIYSNLFGEIASFLYCTCAIFYTFIKSKYNNTHKKSSLMSKIREMFKFSFPLTANPPAYAYFPECGSCSCSRTAYCLWIVKE